ncbi:MAG TPA: tetratricopeptide repeat protein [Candidatus Dormibacteraeota bacterium]|nr:tetratricopeptide repeat protein [Candidatus Dormibacteraeota bacterium]
MPTDSESDRHLEIGHVLFIDIVGYSKLLIDEQRERIQELREIVRGTEQFRLAEAEGKLMRLPTGDGGALVFRTSPEAPVLCALEISKALKTHPELRVRMGIHSGPVNEVADLNEQANMAGAGINIAQRVMDCGDAGHILLSKHVAEDLEHSARWRPQLHDLGECDIKHGGRLHLVNLCTEELGNSQPPTKFRQAVDEERRAISKSRQRPFARRRVLMALLILFAAAVGGGYYFFSQRPAFKAPDKSIAVLPFENLSHDPDNAYFAEGMQDEILARLSKIADLKVISRTSTQKYKSAPDNLREIAKQLGVANILEGSVQKAADQVRVNVQLINALNDAHLWGDIYDRKLTDIFAVESDIAKTIADTLQAKLTGEEKQLIAAQPTSDLTAYDLYLKGRLLWSKRGGENLRQAIAFYEQAIARDPNYALAYAGLAEAYVILPVYTATAPFEAFPKAKTAALKALQLDDKLAEAHTGFARVLCYEFDMVGSISEFQRAIVLNPNYATAHQWYGRHPLAALGRFDEAIAEGKRAIDLDPLSPVINTDLGYTLINARRDDEAIAQLRKTLEIDPTFYYAHYTLGMALQLKGDLPAAIAEYTKAQQLTDNNLRARVLLAAAKAQSGDKEAAVQMLAELEELSRNRNVRATWRALLYLSLGNRVEAVRWLEQGVSGHEDVDITFIKVDPQLDPLRGDPRFEALVQKVVGSEHK